MKEMLRQTLTTQAQERYSKGGDIFMADGPGQGENVPKGMHVSSDVDATTQRLEEINRQRAQRPPRAEAERAGGAGIPPGRGDKPPKAPPLEGDQPEEPNNQSEDRSQEREPLQVTDRKAADLIAKFRQEHGENDPAKIQQLRNNLSGRIEELMKEQIELGARDGARTPEGELTTAATASIDELNDRIREIQEVLAEIFPSQEGGRRGDPLVTRLNKESEEFVRGLLGRGLKISEINDLTKLTPGEKAKRAALIHEIKEFIEAQPSIETSSFNPDILLAVRHFTELREELISDILFKSFQDKSETNEYEVGLYAASNLDILLGFLSKDDNNRYKELFSLRTATRFFQTMNSTVIKGTFDSFGHSAENINYQHFENMRDIGGSGLVMRLFEQAYRDTLAADKKVTQEKIAGIKQFVETTLKKINEAGLIKSEYAEYRTDSKMENWEIQRALAAGRTFFNITLRAAENIATGQVPMDRGRYTSPPQEDMVRILNWNQWLLARFAVGGNKAGRHGEEFLKMSTDRWEEFLRYKGAKLGINGISEVGGVDVRKMEEGGQYRTSGVYSGWRMENLAFDQVYFNLNGQRTSVQQFMDKELISKNLLERLKKKDVANFLSREELEKGEVTVIDAVKAFKKAIEKRGQINRNEDPTEWVKPEDQEDYKDILIPVVSKLNYGLSMLLKNGDFGAQDSKLGYELRKEIWERIAKTNTPLMMDYLTGIKYEWDKLDGKDGIDEKLAALRANKNKSAEEKQEETQLQKERKELMEKKTAAETKGSIAKSLKQLRDEFAKGWTEERWETFRQKELVRFERTIREGMGEQLPPVVVEYELSADEKKLEDAIKEQGQKLAPHLADIVFAYTPFMNDMPFEKFDYVKLGQTFYKRRSTNDLGGFNKGQQAFAKIMSNPGGIPVKDAVAAMGEIIAGVESPEGPSPAIEANFPTFSALLDVVTTDSGKRQAIFKMLLEATRTETSIAQRWQGIKADSFIESEAANLIDETTRAGILTPELARYLKKEKRLTLPFILWMLFRDVFIVTLPIAIGTELFNAIKAKQN